MGVAASLTLSGCSQGEQTQRLPIEPSVPSSAIPDQTGGVPVRNIMDFAIRVSSSPDRLDESTLQGHLAVGQTALAKCLVDKANSYTTDMFIEIDDGGKSVSGYAAAHIEFSKEGYIGDVVSPGLAELKTLLPTCSFSKHKA